MVESNITDDKLKDVLKQAIIEIIEERKDFVHSIIMDVIEDLATIKAIKEGEESKTVDRDKVFQILEGHA